MSKVTVINKLPSFQKSLYNVLDDAIKEGARDTLINAKNKAPYKGGDLRGDTDIKKRGALNWRVSFWMEYARFQEFGGDAKRVIRNYTTAGTGKHYLKTAGDQQAMKLTHIIKKHCGRTRA